MKEIIDIDFNEKVIKLTKETKKPFILFFYSNNCTYCHIVENMINLTKDKYNFINFFKIKTNDNPILVKSYLIRCTPTLLIFDKDCFLKESFIGSKFNTNLYLDILEELKKDIIKEKKIFTIFKRMF